MTLLRFSQAFLHKVEQIALNANQDKKGIFEENRRKNVLNLNKMYFFCHCFKN